MPKRPHPQGKPFFCEACGGTIPGRFELVVDQNQLRPTCGPCARACRALASDIVRGDPRRAQRLRLARLALLTRAILVERRGWGAWL
jgi:hypothetical protein